MKLINEFRTNDIGRLAKALTYNVFLAIFPFVIFIMSVFALFDIDYSLIYEVDFLPHFLVDFVREASSVRSASILSASLLFALNSTSAGIRQIMRGLESFHKLRRKRGFIRVTAHSLLALLALILAIIVSAVFFVFGNSIRYLFYGFLGSLGFAAISIVTAVAITCLTVLLIYYLALDRQFKLKKLLPGAVFTTAAWILASFTFSIYVSYFNNFSRLYGSIAGIAILMIWIFMLCLALLVGGLINAIVNQEKMQNQ